jgi:hypothetical protein
MPILAASAAGAAIALAAMQRPNSKLFLVVFMFDECPLVLSADGRFCTTGCL